MRRPYLVAFLGGATISLLPAWLVAQIASRFPSLAPQELEIVSEFFRSGIGIPQILVLLIIAAPMPIFEEWLFRGVLWRWFSRGFSPVFTWIIVSFIFAMAHWEFLHVIGLLPLSFFLGWLRLKTNELGPPTVAHITNNLVACALMFL